MLVHVGFLVSRVALERTFVQVLQFTTTSIYSNHCRVLAVGPTIIALGCHVVCITVPNQNPVGFVVDKVALGQLFSEFLDFPLSVSFHQYSIFAA